MKNSPATKRAKKKYNQTEKGKAANNTYSQRWKAAHPETMYGAYRKYDLKRYYGLTIAQFDAMWAAQGMKCAACGSEHSGRKNMQWCIDHDHNEKKLHARAIICNGCNIILGYAKDSIPRLQMIGGYLERINDRT